MSLHLARTRAGRGGLLAALVAALAAAVVLPSTPASAAAGPVIGSSFFGVHHQGLHADGPIGFPQAPVGSIRLWDNHVAWRDIETSPGVFDWTLLDAEMAKAREHGATALLVLGQ